MCDEDTPKVERNSGEEMSARPCNADGDVKVGDTAVDFDEQFLKE